jgi:hypothetical protein
MRVWSKVMKSAVIICPWKNNSCCDAKPSRDGTPDHRTVRLELPSRAGFCPTHYVTRLVISRTEHRQKDQRNM